jgi:hypothetical protein
VVSIRIRRRSWVAWVVPLARVIVPSLPVTPDPAVAGPLTGGQDVAHDPLHLEVLEVSGANQYKVNPWALASTLTPPMVVVFSVLPLAACVPEFAAGGVLLIELELPQAPIIEAAASPAGASHLCSLLASNSSTSQVP